jgi:phage terminase large subunit
MNTFVDIMDDADVMEMQGNLTTEQRSYWDSVIERDMRDRDKTKSYLTLDEFEQKLTAAAIKLYA